jgi:hypothetical protein
MRWLEKIDMNVILVCHSKAKWVRRGKEIYQDGTTFDGYDKLEYILDLWCEIVPGGKTILVRKSRIESLPQGQTMPVSYDKFAEIYGKETIEESSTPAEMATDEQVAEIKGLVEALNVGPDQIEKWFKKVSVEDWSEMTSAQIDSLTQALKKKINQITKGE